MVLHPTCCTLLPGIVCDTRCICQYCCFCCICMNPTLLCTGSWVKIKGNTAGHTQTSGLTSFHSGFIVARCSMGIFVCSCIKGVCATYRKPKRELDCVSTKGQINSKVNCSKDTHRTTMHVGLGGHSKPT